jgi:hypothetical protein
MATKINLYNGALLLCGERFLASLTEEVEPRRLLDHAWDTGGVRAALEKGQWHFAMRTVLVDYDPGIAPDFGYARAFLKPTDWVLTSALCSDEYFNSPLTQYADEAGYWYSDLDVIYVRYVSDDSSYGGDLAHWPESFREYMEAYLACKIVKSLTADKDTIDEVEKEEKERLEHAKSRAAMAAPTSFPARGAWSRSRSRSTRGDRGNLSGDLY